MKDREGPFAQVQWDDFGHLNMQVDFDPRLVNSVGILGNLGQPFTLRRLQSGMCVASARVAVKNAKKESEWCADTPFALCRHSMF